MKKRSLFSWIIALSLAVSASWAAPAPVCSDLFLGLGLKTSPYLGSSRQHPIAKALNDIYEGRSDEAHYRMDQAITKRHADLEMSFQVKNPNTGFYDKFVAVPVTSRVAVLDESSFESMVQSTGPVLRALRKLLQKVYSAPMLNSHHLGIDHLPESAQKLILQVISESIYFEPRFRSAEMMDYPFLSVSGFDGAIGDPENPTPKFFEMNLGTPSGLSNNAVLLENLLKEDFAAAQILRPHLVSDKTFLRLRQTIEDSALHWTGVPGGLSVIVSPGIYNGAHADVAEISRRTGMPIVKASDMYMDAGGFIRLNTGKGQHHPMVTGIYGRSEESFFFQNSQQGVPMISPNFVETNERLSQQLGLSLRPGAIYKYIKNAAGEVVDVERGADGRPVLEEVWDQIGVDPTTGRRNGSFLEALINRRLYYPIGGRVVDDKRLFDVVSKYLAAGEQAKMVAQPVSSLDRSQYHLLFENPEKYVVKEPANSGGQGVYFLSQETAANRKKILDRVRTRPQDFEVQELQSPNTVVRYEKKGRRIQKTEVVTDMRFFVFMDSEGKVSSGANGGLLRTGPPGILYSNTSKGGGYGVFAVVRSESSPSLQLPPPDHVAQPALAASKAGQAGTVLSEILHMFRTLPKVEPGDSAAISNLQSQLRNLSFVMRDLLELLPEQLRYYIGQLRNLADQPVEKIDPVKVRRWLTDLLLEIKYSARKFESPIQKRIHQFFQDYSYELEMDFEISGHWSSPVPHGLRSSVVTRPFAQPEVTYFYNDSHGRNEKIETAEVVDVGDPLIRSMLDEVKAAGGEIRLVRVQTRRADGSVVYNSTPSYFWVNYTRPELTSYMRPVIAWNPFEPRALASLKHEFEHFKHWQEIHQELLAQGVAPEEATKTAFQRTSDDEQLLEGERRAVNAEIAAETDQDLSAHLFNRRRANERPRTDLDFGIVNRRLYPEFEVVHRLLLRIQTGNAEPDDPPLLIQLMDTMIRTAAEAKQNALNARTLHPDARQKWESAPLLDLIIYPFGIERLQSKAVVDPFLTLYRERLSALGLVDDSGTSKIFEQPEIEDSGN